MIFQSTLDTLTEEEESILFLICYKFIAPLGYDTKYNFLKSLRVNVVLGIIDVLKSQALPEKQEIFESLKKKLTA